MHLALLLLLQKLLQGLAAARSVNSISNHAGSFSFLCSFQLLQWRPSARRRQNMVLERLVPSSLSVIHRASTYPRSAGEPPASAGVWIRRAPPLRAPASEESLTAVEEEVSDWRVASSKIPFLMWHKGKKLKLLSLQLWAAGCLLPPWCRRPSAWRVRVWKIKAHLFHLWDRARVWMLHRIICCVFLFLHAANKNDNWCVSSSSDRQEDNSSVMLRIWCRASLHFSLSFDLFIFFFLLVVLNPIKNLVRRADSNFLI